MKNSFRYFNSSPEVIRVTVMMYVRYPLALRQVEDLLNRRDIFQQNRPAALAEWRQLGLETPIAPHLGDWFALD